MMFLIKMYLFKNSLTYLKRQPYSMSDFTLIFTQYKIHSIIIFPKSSINFLNNFLAILKQSFNLKIKRGLYSTSTQER